MIADFSAALRQMMADPRLWKVVVLCFLLSLAAFAGCWAGLGWLLQWAASHSSYLKTVLEWGAWIGSLLVALLLFPALFGFIGGLFYEQVADAVDAREFPMLPPADGAPLLASLVSGLKYFVLLVVLNAFALPLYFTLLWVFGAGAGLYVAVNGVLIGREQYDAVALRRLAPGEAKAWRRRHRFLVFRYGALTALLGLVPFVNFIAPLIGVAAMTRLVNRSILPGGVTHQSFP